MTHCIQTKRTYDALPTAFQECQVPVPWSLDQERRLKILLKVDILTGTLRLAGQGQGQGHDIVVHEQLTVQVSLRL